MNGQAVDQFVSENARNCGGCKSYASKVGFAFSDLRDAIRKANRSASHRTDRRPTPEHLIDIKQRKDHLAHERAEALVHMEEAHG